MSTRFNTTHGMTKTPTYKSWQAMRSRCLCLNDKDYRYYGAIGIKIEWGSFEEFLKDMGLRPSREHTIDRVDSRGHYCKANCRWATADVQYSNKKSCVYIEFGGERLTMIQWARKLGVPFARIQKRYVQKKWTAERTLFEPVDQAKSKAGMAGAIAVWSAVGKQKK